MVESDFLGRIPNTLGDEKMITTGSAPKAMQGGKKPRGKMKKPKAPKIGKRNDSTPMIEKLLKQK